MDGMNTQIEDMDDLSDLPHKIRKPLVEKRRRERINKSLDDMKSLVLGALNKDVSEYSKMEKADILEMTVNYLQDVRHRELTVASACNPAVVGRYKTGFTECAQEVIRYMSAVTSINPELRLKLLQHLANSVQQVHNFTPFQPELHTASPQMAPLYVQIPSATQSMFLPGSTSHGGLVSPPLTETHCRQEVPSCTRPVDFSVNQNQSNKADLHSPKDNDSETSSNDSGKPHSSNRSTDTSEQPNREKEISIEIRHLGVHKPIVKSDNVPSSRLKIMRQKSIHCARSTWRPW